MAFIHLWNTITGHIEDVYVFATLDQQQVTALLAQLVENVNQNQQTFSLHPGGAQYIWDKTPRQSLFNRKKRWQAAHIMLPNQAYLIVYIENSPEVGMITDFVNAIDIDGIITLLYTSTS